MTRTAAGLALALLLLCGSGQPLAAAPDDSAATPLVVGLEFVSPHRFPEELARLAVGDLAGRPRSRAEVREGMARLWSLGLFDEVWAEEVAVPGGLRLRIHLLRRPFLRHLAWVGDPGVDLADLAEAATLALGDDASAARLEQARQRLLKLYEREGYFAAAVAIRSVAEPESNGQDVTVELRAGRRARIREIRLQGEFHHPVETLRGLIRLSPGDAYREAVVAERLRAAEERLRKDGYFEARLTPGAPRWDPASNDLSIEITAHDGPRYRIQLEGRQAMRESRLLERLTFSENGIVDDFEVEDNARQLQAAYQEEGYAFAEVRGTVIREEGGGTIRFEIREGPRVTVEAVSLAGNDSVPSEDLANALQTRPPRFPFRSGVFRQDALDRDVRVIVALYHSRGFPDVRVGPADLSFSDGRQHVRIAIPIVEGPRLTVGPVAVEGAHVFSTAEILAALPLATGDPWTQERVTLGERAVRALYARRGYLNPDLTTESVRREGSVHVLFRIRERRPTRLGRILVSGLATTHAEVVERELPLRPGDPLDSEAVTLAERRLVRLGIFDKVEAAPLPASSPAFSDVEFRLKEGRPWRLDFGGGYNTDSLWRAFLEVGHDNLFGTGRGASLRETVRSDGDRTNLSFRDPYLFATSWQGDLTLFREYKQEDGYKRQEAGTAVGVQRLLLEAERFGAQYAGDRIATDRTRGLRGQLSYRFNWVRRYDVDPNLAAADVVAGSQLVASLTPALSLDLRDSLFNPTRGSQHLLSLEFGSSLLGSEVSFLKGQLEATWYSNWLSPTVLVGAARLGLATPFGGTEALAIEDRFKAGGSTTIRGYPQDKVGPLDSVGNPVGGNARILLNLEWRLPIWGWLAAAGFVDTGTVVPNVRDLRLQDFKTGVGGGLRINTPVGAFRLDVGYALNRIPGEDRWQVYFDFGHAF
ncbi:MAG TPA: outer membrane protein assembly factor BamA [Candidatus Methylomirabilis sp.]|nr:outer membrane protein assembly factor BamA [Candidatus Methylomirabilis sp.]